MADSTDNLDEEEEEEEEDDDEDCEEDEESDEQEREVYQEKDEGAIWKYKYYIVSPYQNITFYCCL